jgi:hypothetical protein
MLPLARVGNQVGKGVVDVQELAGQFLQAEYAVVVDGQNLLLSIVKLHVAKSCQNSPKARVSLNIVRASSRSL